MNVYYIAAGLSLLAAGCYQAFRREDQQGGGQFEGRQSRDLYYPPDEAYRTFFTKVLGLELPEISGDRGAIPQREVEKFGELLPAVAEDNPKGEGNYLEKGEIGYLRDSLRVLGVGGERNSDEKLSLVKQFLHDDCWGKRGAVRNLFRRFLMGSTYLLDKGVVFGTNDIGLSQPNLLPNTECDYTQMPKGLLLGHPVPTNAPVPLTPNLYGFECRDIGRSILRFEYEMTMATVAPVIIVQDGGITVPIRIQDVPAESSLFVIDKDKGYLLSARHSIVNLGRSTTHIKFVGEYGETTVPASDIKVGFIDGKDVVLVKFDNPEILQQYEDIQLAYPDLAAHEKNWLGIRYAAGYSRFLDDDKSWSPSFLVVEAMIPTGLRSYSGALVAGMSGGPTVDGNCRAVAVNSGVDRYWLESVSEPINEALIRTLEGRLRPLAEFLQTPHDLRDLLRP